MRFSGLVMRTGVPLPPSAGPARAQHCVNEGLPALTRAGQLVGAAWRRVAPVLGAAAGMYEAPPNLARGVSEQTDPHRESVERWRRQKFLLEQSLRDDSGPRIRELMVAAERDAREALSAATQAFYWLDDILWDYPPGTIIARPDGREETLGKLAERAHSWAHRAGELVGGLFGCRIVWDEGRWWRECQLSLLHNRLGQSPGFSVRTVCSVCGNDPLTCPHPPGSTHLVVATKIDGNCSICQRSECQHVAGQEYAVPAGVVAVDPVLHEVSLVPRPKDPLARITRVEISRKEMVREMGELPTEHTQVFCYSCLGPCRGIRERADTLV